jgi:hypothetical protein
MKSAAFTEQSTLSRCGIAPAAFLEDSTDSLWFSGLVSCLDRSPEQPPGWPPVPKQQTRSLEKEVSNPFVNYEISGAPAGRPSLHFTGSAPLLPANGGRGSGFQVGPGLPANRRIAFQEPETITGAAGIVFRLVQASCSRAPDYGFNTLTT